MIEKIDLKTRKILHKVHQNRISNKKGLKRVSNYISTETLGFKKNYFKNKICGEFGCGSHGEGGVITRFVMEILWDEYYNSKSSKKIIDMIMDNKIHVYENFFKRELSKKNFKILKSFLQKISDNVFRMTIKDRILSPKYDLYNEKKLKQKLYKLGFSKFKRTPIKPNFQNIRDLLVPFYFNYDHPLSKFLYGDGQIRFTIQKK